MPTTTPYDQWAIAMQRVVTILKKRFPNLTVEESVILANELVKSVLESHTTKGEV